MCRVQHCRRCHCLAHNRRPSNDARTTKRKVRKRSLQWPFGAAAATSATTTTTKEGGAAIASYIYRYRTATAYATWMLICAECGRRSVCFGGCVQLHLKCTQKESNHATKNERTNEQQTCSHADWLWCVSGDGSAPFGWKLLYFHTWIKSNAICIWILFADAFWLLTQLAGLWIVRYALDLGQTSADRIKKKKLKIIMQIGRGWFDRSRRHTLDQVNFHVNKDWATTTVRFDVGRPK